MTADTNIVLQHRARVEAFQRKHRVGLLTPLFTAIVGSVQLKQQSGDVEAVNEGADWQGSIRFNDAQGNPVKGLKVTLTP